MPHWHYLNDLHHILFNIICIQLVDIIVHLVDVILDCIRANVALALSGLRPLLASLKSAVSKRDLDWLDG